MNYNKAKSIADKYVNLFRPFCKRIEIAGSIRRKRPEVGDIEIVCIRDTRQLYQWKELIDGFRIIKGTAVGKYVQLNLKDGINLDLFMCFENNFGLIYAIRTGSAEYSHQVLAVGWNRAGYTSKEGVLYPDEKNPLKEKIYIREEEELFKLIGIPYVEPEKREI